LVVAMDGPAGVGKSTICRRIAEENNILYLNSGSLYRGITYYLLRENKAHLTESDIVEVVKSNVDMSFVEGELHLNNRNIEPYLRTDSVDSNVARISAIVGIRRLVNQQIQKISQSLDIIVEGRDMTTVVFPHAEVKIYLDASIKKRALRRYNQGVSELTLEEIEEKIAQRDKIDRNKEEGSLKIADGAIYLDTSDLTIDEVCEKVTSRIKELL